jgi:hypothetical protein
MGINRSKGRVDDAYMAENPINPDKKEETKEAFSARDAFLFGEKEKQREFNRKRKQFLEEQSIREGFRYLTKSTFQFICSVVLGAFLIIKSRDFQIDNHGALGNVLVIIGAVLILNGMLILGGFRYK